MNGGAGAPRVALLDPADFTPPYDEALGRSLANLGCEVKLYGSATSKEVSAADGAAQRDGARPESRSPSDAADGAGPARASSACLAGSERPAAEPLGQGDALESFDAGDDVPKPSGSFSRDRFFYRSLKNLDALSLPPLAVRALKGPAHAAGLIRLRSALRRFGPAVVHAQWAPLPLLDRPALAAARRFAPLVVTVHDTELYNGDGGPGAALMRAGWSKLLRAADALIVHTRRGFERLEASGLDPAKLHVLPHGPLHAPPAPLPYPPVPDARGKLVLLLFGKLKPYKGLDVLLDALATLAPAERGRFEVRVVGKPYMDTSPLERFAAERGLSGQGGCVRFSFGFATEAELERHFGQAHALLFPYREIEASGVLGVAVARGLPVLASRVGLFGEALQDGREARLVPTEDAQALAGVLRGWAADPSELERLAAGMRDHRESAPAWDGIAGSTLEVYARAREAWGRSTGRPAASGEVAGAALRG